MGSFEVEMNGYSWLDAEMFSSSLNDEEDE